MCRDCDYELMRMMLTNHMTGREVEEWYFSRCCYHHLYRREKWITVYLSDYEQMEGKDNCYGLVLDFYTYSDYLHYLEYRNELKDFFRDFNFENPRLSTFFYLSDYKSDIKPRRGHYYMNLEVLSERWLRKAENNVERVELDTEDRPSYFVATFIENIESQYPDMRLLVQSEPLSYPQWMFLNVLRPVTITTPSSNEYCLRVNDVEQGNWNEILVDGNTFLMYDIGTNAYGRNIEQSIQRQLTNHRIQQDIEALFISHWHADHYNILTGMNYDELNHINQLVCTSSVYNLTAFTIIMWFALNPNKILSVQNYPIGVQWQKTTVINNRLNLYVRRYVKSNPNNGGLLLFFNGEDNCVTLTGDANYSTMQGVTNDGISQFNSQGKYYMVVPHHGGNAGRFTCSINPRVKLHEAIISVGADNPYNHPDKKIESHLKAVFSKVAKTSVSKSLVRHL